MKKSTIITALAAIMMTAVTPAFAQEENGFKKFNVREDFTENGFQWFHDVELLAAGNNEVASLVEEYPFLQARRWHEGRDPETR